METIRSELLAIWSILLIALLVALVLLVRPIRQCIDCVPMCTCFYDAIKCIFQWLLSDVLCDMYNSTKAVIQTLPLVWYPMAVLTVIPICYHIPRDGAVVFLAAYCVAGMLVCSAEPKKKKKDEESHVTTDSEFFMGMKIKIDLD